MYFVLDSGVARLTSTNWTLQAKADHFESMLPIFDLYSQGLVGGCGYASFGREPCTAGKPPPSTNVYLMLLSYLCRSRRQQWAVDEPYCGC